VEELLGRHDLQLLDLARLDIADRRGISLPLRLQIGELAGLLLGEILPAAAGRLYATSQRRIGRCTAQQERSRS
jgi:hypothetical protein